MRAGGENVRQRRWGRRGGDDMIMGLSYQACQVQADCQPAVFNVTSTLIRALTGMQIRTWLLLRHHMDPVTPTHQGLTFRRA
jgi:hypothetical protein